MKTKYLSIPFLLIATSLSVIASPAEDRKIENAVHASYNYRAVLEQRVKAKASDGVVTLTGTVQDKDDKALAEDTVANLPGVTRVQNDVVISATYPERSDAWMAFKIRGQLLVKGNVSATSTTVAVQDGVVTLGGSAENVAQKELTEIYAKEIEGVKSVTNNIVVKAEPNTEATLGENIDDASITTQVKFALLRHKSTSALQTKVSTNGGRIIITGDAASEAEKSLVTKLAEDVRGVKSVSNGMTVKG